MSTAQDQNAGYPQQGGSYPQEGYTQGGFKKGDTIEPPQPGFQPAACVGAGYGEPAGHAAPVYSGDEDGLVKGFDFTEQSIRRAFIRKVYAILMCQLLVTMGFICLFLFHQPTKQWVHHNRRMSYVAFAVIFVVLVVMACCGEVRRKAPMNFICLGIITVGESFILGVVSSLYNVDTVLIAVGITAALCLALTLFAFQTKWDFTMMGGMLFCFLVILILFGLASIFLHYRIVTLVYASLGALIFSFYLVYDTQLMMGGKHKYSVSPEEYIFAALNLYLDIINIFLYILLLLARIRR